MDYTYIRNQIRNNSDITYLKSKINQSDIFYKAVSKNGYLEPINIGEDGDSVETRVFVITKYYNIIKKILKILKDSLCNTDFYSSLHIHIPISKKSLQYNQNFSQFEKTYYNAVIKVRAEHGGYSECATWEEVKKEIKNNLSERFIPIAFRNRNCQGCIGCGKLKDQGLIGNSLKEDIKRNAYNGKIEYKQILNSHQCLIDLNLKYKRLISLLQTHIYKFYGESEKTNYYIDERGGFVQIQSQFNTAEYRTLSISTDLSTSEVLLRVFVVKALHDVVCKIKPEKYLEYVVNFIDKYFDGKINKFID